MISSFFISTNVSQSENYLGITMPTLDKILMYIDSNFELGMYAEIIKIYWQHLDIFSKKNGGKKLKYNGKISDGFSSV